MSIIFRVYSFSIPLDVVVLEVFVWTERMGSDKENLLHRLAIARLLYDESVNTMIRTTHKKLDLDQTSKSAASET